MYNTYIHHFLSGFRAKILNHKSYTQTLINTRIHTAFRQWLQGLSPERKFLNPIPNNHVCIIHTYSISRLAAEPWRRRPAVAGGPGRTERWQNFSKVLQKMTLSSTYNRALTLPDLFLVPKKKFVRGGGGVDTTFAWQKF
jgi:hypothetical protein